MEAKMQDRIVIVDVGAANGFNSVAWEQFKDRLQLIMFEPDQRSFNNLVASQNELVYNAALAECEETRDLYLTRKPELSSFYRPNKKYLDLFPNKDRWDILECIQVKTSPLHSFQEQIGQVDFMKLDTQGSELEILRGSAQMLQGCLGVELEVEFIELYEGQPLFGDVCQYLKSRGFEFYDFITEYRYGRKELNRRGQLAFADAIFLRTPEYVYQFLPDSVLKYLYVCATYGKDDLIKVIKDLFPSIENVITLANNLSMNILPKP